MLKRGYTKRIAAIAMLLFFFFSPLAFGEERIRTIHVFVALCDNKYQGIVPVPPKLGKGEDPAGNLYWGALYGIKTYFNKSPRWKYVSTITNPCVNVMERCVFEHREGFVYLIADAYRGSAIKQTIVDFLRAVSGNSKDRFFLKRGAESQKLEIQGSADLVVYLGHNGLMDFTLEYFPAGKDRTNRFAIILACMSRKFFRTAIEKSGAEPILWATGLLAPEAYTLESALEGWVKNETADSIRKRAALTYSKYQKCSLKSAMEHLASRM